MTAITLVILGIILGESLEARGFAIEQRYQLYQLITRRLSFDEPYPERTVLVTIRDEEFWKGYLARRIPLKRDYLGTLIEKISSADPSAIALDLDLRSPTPDGSLIDNPDYAKESGEFLDKVQKTSQKTPIILPKTIAFAEGYYYPEPDIYENFDFRGGKVSFGYVLLPFDYRRVPLAVNMKDGSTLDSLAEAMVRVDNPEALKTVVEGGNLPFGYYLSEGQFTKVSASDVYSANTDALRKLHHRIVIVGGEWSARGYGRGSKVDMHSTPAGPLPGALMHANFVESLVHRRTYRTWGQAVVIVLDLLMSILVAIIFALTPRLLWKSLAGLGIFFVLFLLSYASWRNLGIFYDSFIPGVLVISHGLYEQVREWVSDKEGGG